MFTKFDILLHNAKCYNIAKSAKFVKIPHQKPHKIWGNSMTTKRQHFTWIDIIILTLIFFGLAIYSSMAGFFALTANSQVAPETLSFDGNHNMTGIIQELITLLIAFGYLSYRNFDFKQFKININRYVPLQIIAYILLAGTVATLCEYALMIAVPEWYPHLSQNDSQTVYDANAHLSQFSLSLFGFALLNGFFEELYFLGILFAIPKKYYVPIMLIFALIVRFSFHTYQGLAGAIVIMSLGIVFFLLRLKNDNLLPFMLAHSFFDVFGLGLPIYWLWD